MIYQCRTCRRQPRVKPFTTCKCGSLGFWKIGESDDPSINRNLQREPEVYEGLGVERLDLGTKKQETKVMQNLNYDQLDALQKEREELTKRLHEIERQIARIHSTGTAN